MHVAKGLTEAQARAFRIMDNRSSENAEWDKDLLNLELADLLEADFDLGLTGFTDDELNALMNSLDDGTGPQEGEDEIPDTPEDPISRPGDLWMLGNHRLLCGDSTVATDVERLWHGETAADGDRSTVRCGVRPELAQSGGCSQNQAHRQGAER